MWGILSWHTLGSLVPTVIEGCGGQEFHPNTGRRGERNNLRGSFISCGDQLKMDTKKH